MTSVKGNEANIAKQRQSWLLATVFAGLGTGFIAFWVTLSAVNSGVLGLVASLVVWPITRNFGGNNFATKAVLIYLLAVAIGIGVGFASDFGTGVPVNVP